MGLAELYAEEHDEMADDGTLTTGIIAAISGIGGAGIAKVADAIFGNRREDKKAEHERCIEITKAQSTRIDKLEADIEERDDRHSKALDDCHAEHAKNREELGGLRATIAYLKGEVTRIDKQQNGNQ